MKKKKRRRLILDIIMFGVMIGGAIALLYPFVSEALTNFWNQQVVNYYQEKSNKENLQAIEKEQARLKEKNKRIAKMGAPGSDPFTNKKAAIAKPDKDYYQKHTIAVIRIPKIKVELPVFDQTNDVFLKRGAALLEGTSYPNGGPDTHTVITSHRGLTRARLFSDLPKLKKGNRFYLEHNKQTLAYKVDKIQTIKPTEVEALNIIKGEDHVTLMTCTPYGVNSHRLLVRGVRIPLTAVMKKEVNGANRMRNLFYAGIIIGSILFLLLLWKIARKRIKVKKVQ